MNFSHYQPFGSIPQPHLVDSDADSTFSPFPYLGHHQTHQMALAPIHSAAVSFPGTSMEMDAQQQIQHNPLDHLWVDVQGSTFACLWAECEQRFVGGEVFEAHMGQHLAGYASLLQGWHKLKSLNKPMLQSQRPVLCAKCAAVIFSFLPWRNFLDTLRCTFFMVIRMYSNKKYIIILLQPISNAVDCWRSKNVIRS